MDVIDRLAGVAAGSSLDRIRDQRAQARRHAQASYDSLLEPLDEADATRRDRHALAVYVALLHQRPAIADFYAGGIASEPALLEALRAAAAAGLSKGPYGRYPKGPLSVEDEAGPTHRLEASLRAALGERLAAACEHTHMLVYHPRDASAGHLQALLDAGWSTTGIVVLSQLVAFLSYQIRVVTGLSVLRARPA